MSENDTVNLQSELNLMIHRKVKKWILWSLTNKTQAKILSLLLNTTISKIQQSYDSADSACSPVCHWKSKIYLSAKNPYFYILCYHFWEGICGICMLLCPVSTPGWNICSIPFQYQDSGSCSGQNISLVGTIDLRLFSCTNLTCVAGLWHFLFWYREFFPMDAHLTRVDNPQKES